MEVFVAFGDAPAFEEAPYDGGEGEAVALSLEGFEFVVGFSELAEEVGDVLDALVVFFVVGSDICLVVDVAVAEGDGDEAGAEFVQAFVLWKFWAFEAATLFKVGDSADLCDVGLDFRK